MIINAMAEIRQKELLDIQHLPDIDLYMDQVLTILSSELQSHKRVEEEPVITKTMVNNYAKHGLISPPIKKKYNKEQIISLGLIFHLKNILSLKDIESLFSMVESTSSEKSSMEKAYTHFLEIHQPSVWEEEVKEKLELFHEENAMSDESLFLFLLLLLLEAVQTKQLVEKVLDLYVATSL